MVWRTIASQTGMMRGMAEMSCRPPTLRGVIKRAGLRANLMASQKVRSTALWVPVRPTAYHMYGRGPARNTTPCKKAGSGLEKSFYYISRPDPIFPLTYTRSSTSCGGFLIFKNFHKSILKRILIGLVALLSVTPAFAQTQPDAGAIQQQFRRQPPQLPVGRAEAEPEPADRLPMGGPTLQVKRFSFAGNTLLTEKQLAPLLDSYLNRPLDLNGLQLAAAVIGEAYSEAGWLARVYMPQQEVVDGVVTLQVVEARLGKLQQVGEPRRFFPAGPARYIDAEQASGELLNIKRLDRALLLLDDLPGVVAAGNFALGEGQAETDLLLKLEDEPLLAGEVGFDNHGSRSTGEERFTIDTYLNSPLKLGDLLRGNITFTEGNQYLWFNYSLPVGYNGLRVGGNASYLNYDIISPEFKPLDLQGNSRTWGLDANYPIVREKSRNLYMNLAYENKDFDNRLASTTITSNYQIDTLHFSLSGNLFDRLGGGGANFLSFSVNGGDVKLGSLDTNENASLEGSFTKFFYIFSRQQAINSAVSFYASLSGQLTDTNLDSAEKFYLGGPNGVRAYPNNEGGGDEGTLVNLELRYRARSNLVLTGFYDWGEIHQNKDNDANIAPNSYELEGAGLAINWSGPWGLIIEGTYAHRFNNNPNPSTTGNDQDGSLKEDRFWLSTSLPF